ncbi:uncharacterized protein F5Z01DRAFT_61158 [Emericellopsis atlantica]|uniref:Uncharacterized protein n=1 Tax=Emericellopsis atlantica TaxID=2614577 RepID=A0A9P7ZNH6_9HYPO|nr:uncharacterized protein F5Z01DRAFT_61158 [Emericellopsis atlantica]KAG9254931.1 hypothetical protein F5Z01DRAFT_61158 [Emericellopsis atlantica]
MKATDPSASRVIPVLSQATSPSSSGNQPPRRDGSCKLCGQRTDERFVYHSRFAAHLPFSFFPLITYFSTLVARHSASPLPLVRSTTVHQSFRWIFIRPFSFSTFILRDTVPSLNSITMSSMRGHDHVELKAGEPREYMATRRTVASTKRSSMAFSMLIATFVCAVGGFLLCSSLPSLALAESTLLKDSINDHFDPLVARDEPESDVTSTLVDGGIMVPISTQTQLETFYSISMPEPSATSSSMEEDACAVEVVTQTQTRTNMVTVTLWPTLPSEDQTVTGDASTVTDLNTETAYTSDTCDATVSGDPSTVTDFQTEITGYPDVTVSGAPSTVTTTVTSMSIFTTITVSDLFSPLLPPDEPQNTSAAKGDGVIVTGGPLYPTNATVIVMPSEAMTYAPVPTVSPVFGSGAEQSKAFSNVGGALMLAAAVMYVL